MKQGFIRNKWPAMAVVAIFLVAAIMSMEIWMYVFSAIFIISLVVSYIRFNTEESELNTWWEGLDLTSKRRAKMDYDNTNRGG